MGNTPLRLPDPAPAMLAPQSAGASLVVVYRDPSGAAQQILFYDGIAVLPDIAGASCRRRFAASTNLACAEQVRQAHSLVGGGAPNQTERLFFKGAGAEARLRYQSVSRTRESVRRWWTQPDFD